MMFKKKKQFFIYKSENTESCIRLAHISVVIRDGVNILIYFNGSKDVSLTYENESIAISAYKEILSSL